MRVPLFWRVLPVYILIVCIFAIPIWQNHLDGLRAIKAAAVAEAELGIASKESQLIKGMPNRIVLPKQAIDIPVVEGAYNGQATVWTVANGAANYAQNTAVVNNRHSKSLIYGHWTQRIFGKTSHLKLGDPAYVLTTNHHVFKFIFVNKKVVKPTEVGIFKSFKGKPGLVLMTCQGVWAQERRVMYFELEQAK